MHSLKVAEMLLSVNRARDETSWMCVNRSHTFACHLDVVRVPLASSINYLTAHVYCVNKCTHLKLILEPPYRSVVSLMYRAEIEMFSLRYIAADNT